MPVDKVTSIPKPISKLEENVRTINRDMAAMLEFNRIKAKLQREHYLSLIAEGFTESQAIELCKNGIM